MTEKLILEQQQQQKTMEQMEQTILFSEGVEFLEYEKNGVVAALQVIGDFLS